MQPGQPAQPAHTRQPRQDGTAAQRLRDRPTAEGYVASICFKHGPPRLLGVELEWTVHHAGDPRRPLAADTLCRALGPHAPPTLQPAGIPVGTPVRNPAPLRHGSVVTVEPGGQVELSSQPRDSVSDLLTTTLADVEQLHALLRRAGLGVGDQAVDAHRPPRRLLATPRYDAMQAAFDRIGPHGSRMMCSTAAVQVCLDAGEAATVASRWDALHALGPVLVALFANSGGVGGDGRVWESTRMEAVLGTDPARSQPAAPVAVTSGAGADPVADPAADPAADPVAAWAARVLDTPLLCVRRPTGCWDAPPGVTFADWIDGALPEPPSTDDLDYHLTTLFPPVRPHGYLEVRYLDAQPGRRWMTPVALLAALMADQSTVDEVLARCAGVSGRWRQAAQRGLADPPIAAAAQGVLTLGRAALADLQLTPELASAVHADLDHRLAPLIATKR